MPPRDSAVEEGRHGGGERPNAVFAMNNPDCKTWRFCAFPKAADISLLPQKERSPSKGRSEARKPPGSSAQCGPFKLCQVAGSLRSIWSDPQKQAPPLGEEQEIPITPCLRPALPHGSHLAVATSGRQRPPQQKGWDCPLFSPPITCPPATLSLGGQGLSGMEGPSLIPSMSLLPPPITWVSRTLCDSGSNSAARPAAAKTAEEGAVAQEVAPGREG